jgi:peptidoglycan/xylan/chitin deacetylase (PgdA/CDA1 family)
MIPLTYKESQHRPESEWSDDKAIPLSRLNLSGVPVFNYHGLVESLSDKTPKDTAKYWLSPSKFHSQLVHIRDEGFHTVLLHDLTDRTIDPAHKLRTVVLTFDDGLVSDYEVAFRLLAESGMKAVFFLNTATIGQEGYLNWSQIVEMQQHGMSIQSHSRSHVDLTVLPTPALDAELSESRRRLEDQLGTRVDFLAAPRGLLNRRVVRRALALGYRAVCSTRCLPAKPGSKTFTRITLYRDVTIKEFNGFLDCELSPYARRLSRGLLQGAMSVPGHLCQVLRCRLLKQPAPASR